MSTMNDAHTQRDLSQVFLRAIFRDIRAITDGALNTNHVALLDSISQVQVLLLIPTHYPVPVCRLVKFSCIRDPVDGC
jgi:hypothetical protein